MLLDYADHSSCLSDSVDCALENRLSGVFWKLAAIIARLPLGGAEPAKPQGRVNPLRETFGKVHLNLFLHLPVGAVGQRNFDARAIATIGAISRFLFMRLMAISS